MEKSQAVYGMYRRILWKTFCFGKTAEMRRAARAAGKTFLQLPCPAGKLRFTEKILGAENKIPAIYGEAGRDMVYFILDYHKQNKTLRCGADRPERKEHKKDGRT